VVATAYPTGTVTFLFTDIGGSTRLWESAPDAMADAVAEHYAILGAAVDEQGGTVFKTVGDGVCAAFQKPAAAVAAAIEGQRRLKAYPWPAAIGEIVVRMSIHTGAASAIDGDYFGGTLNRVARLMSLAHPGQILVSHASAALLGDLPTGVQLRTLGVFRLKDLSEPEPTSQVIADGLRPEFPALASLDARPNNLPFQIASFVGRERELHEIQDQLEARRLITIVGPGGIGKTRLALQAAADSVERSPDGTWFVELSAVDDAALIAQALAVVLGVREESQRPLEETIAGVIGAKTMVIILDGVDRVLIGVSALVKKLLSRCSGLRIVATSREPMHLTGERTVRLGALDEAALLFRERASEIDPAAVGLDSDEAIAEICRRLDGIPLALELAAAHVATLSPPDLAARLRRSMKLLVSRDTTKEERHRTLRATISWSYDLLPKSHSTAACDLSVFEGSFDIAAAAAVLGEDEDDALALVDELTLKSMLAVVGGSRPARYTMMSTVREYLRDVTTDVTRARERSLRHFRYFEHLVGQHARIDARALAEWLERIDADVGNVRAALEWGITERPDDAAEVVAVLSAYWKARGFLKEGRAYFKRVLALTGVVGGVRARLLRRAASFAIEQDNYDEARALNLECRRLYEELGDANGVAETYHNLGVIEQRIGKLELAYENYDNAIRSFRATGNAFGEAMALHNIVLLALARGDLSMAQDRIDEAASAISRATDEALSARFTALRARVALKRNEYEKAEAYYREVLAIENRIGNRLEIAVFHSDLAIALLGLRRFKEAQASARLCLEIGLEIDSSALLIYGFEAYCQILLDEGRYERAAWYFGLASALRESHSYGFSSAERDTASFEQSLREKLGAQFAAIRGRARAADIKSAARDAISDELAD